MAAGHAPAGGCGGDSRSSQLAANRLDGPERRQPPLRAPIPPMVTDEQGCARGVGGRVAGSGVPG
jgi:hypothetical protein